jgi:hypothetical protein
MAILERPFQCFTPVVALMEWMRGPDSATPEKEISMK